MRLEALFLTRFRAKKFFCAHACIADPALSRRARIARIRREESSGGLRFNTDWVVHLADLQRFLGHSTAVSILTRSRNFDVDLAKDVMINFGERSSLNGVRVNKKSEKRRTVVPV